MKFVYAPEGATPREWEWPPEKTLTTAEAIQAERLAGMWMPQLTEAIRGGSTLATQVWLFVLLRREVPTLTLDQVEVRLSECSMVWTDDEQRRIAEDLETRAKTGPLSEDESTLLRVLREAVPVRPVDPDPGAEGDASDPTQPPTGPVPPSSDETSPSGSD